MTINYLRQFGTEPLEFCNTSETTSAVEATRVAKSIEQYWRGKGFAGVKAKAVPLARNNVGQVIYSVQSNLKNGMPVGATARDLYGGRG